MAVAVLQPIKLLLTHSFRKTLPKHRSPMLSSKFGVLMVKSILRMLRSKLANTERDYYGIKTNAGGEECLSGICFDDSLGGADPETALRSLEDTILRYRNGAIDPDTGIGGVEPLNVYININGYEPANYLSLVQTAIDNLEINSQILNPDIKLVQFNQFTMNFFEGNGISDSLHIQKHNLYTGNVYKADGSLAFDPANDSGLNSYQEIEALHGKGGIIISFGTVDNTYECNHYKANASQGPYEMGRRGKYTSTEDLYSPDNWEWVNLGQSHSGCNTLEWINDELVTHEMAHVIGLGTHFDRFGEDAVWSQKASAVMQGIMNSPRLTKFDEITISDVEY